MKVYLLDTNQCSQIINKNPEILYRISTLESDDLLVTSVIVCGELIYMAEKSARKRENLLIIRSLMEQISAITIDRKIYDTYASIKTEIFNKFAPKEKKRKRKYKFAETGFGENDLWIVATAIAYNATTVSADSDFSRMQEVINFPLECWAK